MGNYQSSTAVSITTVSNQSFELFAPDGQQIPWIDPDLKRFKKEEVLEVEIALVTQDGDYIERLNGLPSPEQQVFASVYLRVRREEHFHPLECIADLPEAAAVIFGETVAEWYGVELVDYIPRIQAASLDRPNRFVDPKIRNEKHLSTNADSLPVYLNPKGLLKSS